MCSSAEATIDDSTSPAGQGRLELDAVLGDDVSELATAVVDQIASSLDVERARHRPGAEQRATEAGAFLVGPVDDADRHRQLDAVTMECPQHLGTGQHSEAAVEPAAVRNRVEMAAEHDPVGTRARQRHPQVAGRVGVGVDRHTVERRR